MINLSTSSCVFEDFQILHEKSVVFFMQKNEFVKNACNPSRKTHVKSNFRQLCMKTAAQRASQSIISSAKHQDRGGHGGIQGFHLPLHGDLDRICHTG